ncbi:MULTISPECIES: glycosyl hydrolase family 95 catalytic domain-containing protein [Emticicia]|uniref:glycosyl hydrolase family 95 catalytic domain-containing protein n=1 Tax=Emticicia TaxID=312278 RepID=UPI0007D89E94|nr:MULTISPECIES: glycoside hydrolase N-terminal domain-containing protein [Emticicia]
MKNITFFVFLFIVTTAKSQVQKFREALNFSQIPQKWDEGLPLGNGLIGELIWQKESKLRLSLDQAELWDLRPMAELHTPGFNYKLVKEKLLANQYQEIQKIGDIPYEREPAPSKLPGAAIEFNVAEWGDVQAATLNIETAEATITWKNGVKMSSFVDAVKPLGYFKFENIKKLNPELFSPKYEGSSNNNVGGSTVGDDLARLGYTQGNVVKKGNSYKYIQKGWGGFYYEVAVKWQKTGKSMYEGVWSISAHYPNNPQISASKLISGAENYDIAIKKHKNWWKNFWLKSSISIPDPILEKQYYLEQYKFGSTARANTPPISLQAIWTADNGRLPPWKGDFHHDLNTQLSYWPSYAANHLEEAMGYLNHLDKNKKTYKKYTQWYFESDGLAIPGVTDLNGIEMGGWIQYSLSPTVSAWLAQHYYLQWRYSMDREFLQKKAYPFFKDVALFLERISYIDKNGNRQLPISSSPEINDNSQKAWFTENTNYDLALMRFLFLKATELALELNLTKEADHYQSILNQFSNYHLSEKKELKFAKNLPYNESHRHFSHLMSIHPLGEIRWENGVSDQEIIKNSLALLDKVGPGNWCGYSYAWEGNLKARAKDGEGAKRALYDFATAFCSPNSFHLNGDQTKSGKSSFTYRPFTLEGNFAFAAGIQEMLIQSYAGFIEVFPAIPNDWTNLSFKNLRAEGAFIVSAKKVNGEISSIEIMAEKGGKVKLKLPFKNKIENGLGVKVISKSNDFIELDFTKNGRIQIINANNKF